MNKKLYLDCDSTLCAIEGVDELAALRGPEVEKQVIELTNQAMDGTVPIDEVFARRLDLIRPSQAMCALIGEKYIAQLSPGVEAALASLRAQGWCPVIISGGFTQVIEPVAARLGIEEIHAVGLFFDEQGEYYGFDTQAPTARNGGKPDIINSLHKDSISGQRVMVGDGISDWETTPVVDLFVGYGGVVERASVKEQAAHYIYAFNELQTVIESHFS